MEDKVIHVSVKLVLQDYLNFARLASAKTTFFMYGFIISVIVGNIIAEDVSGVIYMLIVLACYEIYWRVYYKKYFESNKIANKEEVYNFNVNGIESAKVDGSGNSNLKWDELYGVKQNKHMICLMTASSSGRIIPKRLLNTEQIADLEALIKNKLGSKVLEQVNWLKYACFGVLIYITTIVLPAIIGIIWIYFY